MKILFGLFLIVHGLIHASFLQKAPAAKPGAPAWPFDITKSWLLTGISVETLRTIGIILTIAATVGFVLSGLGWLGVPLLNTYWVVITTIASITSLLLIAIFWHNWFVVGPIIDIVILYLIYFKGVKPF